MHNDNVEQLFTRLILCVFVQKFLQRFIDPNGRNDDNAGLDPTQPLYKQMLEEVS